MSFFALSSFDKNPPDGRLRPGRAWGALLCAGFAVILLSASARAQSAPPDADAPTPPPTLEELENVPKLNTIVDAGTGVPFDIRMDALKEAALSYGARGGLAMRTFEIRQQLETRARSLDRIFDFRSLLVSAPSGLLIEPPIVSEAANAMIINAGGQDAAVSDRYYRINENARIVSSPRIWRTYLERTWGDVTPPPDVLRPTNKDERKAWVEQVRVGWEKGYAQADLIFEDDLGRLTADYQGMVRYRTLLAQGMISAPYALQVDRGVTGGGNEMRVGDRAVRLTGLPELMPGYEQWQPASR